jgi:lipopolysaccharide transport system ATP-binding protein
MSDIAITVENLSKSYLLGHNEEHTESYTALRDVLASNVRNLARKTRDMINGRALVQGDRIEEFWALKDVSFEIKRGDRVGIIGRNGAGKSTLLKVLSRITEPTKGRVQIAGRVASLLEVGTGFHPELTGRENIFLNGAILGMTRREIQSKFDAIVDFSEVEKFLDTPVKRYSSGMYVKLAFAVAAHLEPEVLIVDEVLAVGDAEFQKKCLGKMDQVSREGRTILFVSHNMDAIERLCGQIIWMQSGKVHESGACVTQIIKSYLHGKEAVNESPEWRKADITKSNPYFDLLSIRMTDSKGNLASRIFSRDTEIQLEIEANISLPDKALNIGYAIYSEDGTVIYWSCMTDSDEVDWPILQIGINRLITTLPQKILNQGIYTIEIMASLHNREWIIEPGKNNSCILFEISGYLSSSPFWYSKRPGLIAPIIKWNNMHTNENIKNNDII